LAITVANLDTLFESDAKTVESLIQLIKNDKTTTDPNWIADQTEKFCQEKALHNAIYESIQIMDGKSKKDKGAIPQVLQDALAISFDPNVGHDYLEDAAERFEFYHRTTKKLPFDLEYFNRITNGGLEPKTLTVILAGTNVGKSLMMCHFAAAYLAQHYNVLYITMEMAEEKIAQRIDANLLNVTLDDLMAMSQEKFDARMAKLKQTVKGKLFVKEYPTAGANANHFRALLNELAMKKQFKPDVVIVDYINICSSARVKPGGTVNSYTHIKAIAEELRGLAVEFKVPLISATQTTRSGSTNSDPGLEDTSESFGLPATADLMFAITTNEDLAKMGHLAVKQLKNRNNDVNRNKRFIIRVDRAKMKLYDVEDQKQDLQDANNDNKDVASSLPKGGSGFAKYKFTRTDVQEKTVDEEEVLFPK
jgi:replicative DNA helicase